METPDNRINHNIARHGKWVTDRAEEKAKSVQKAFDTFPTPIPEAGPAHSPITPVPGYPEQVRAGSVSAFAGTQVNKAEWGEERPAGIRRFISPMVEAAKSRTPSIYRSTLKSNPRVTPKYMIAGPPTVSGWGASVDAQQAAWGTNEEAFIATGRSNQGKILWGKGGAGYVMYKRPPGTTAIHNRPDIQALSRRAMTILGRYDLEHERVNPYAAEFQRLPNISEGASDYILDLKLQRASHGDELKIWSNKYKAGATHWDARPGEDLFEPSWVDEYDDVLGIPARKQPLNPKGRTTRPLTAANQAYVRAMSMKKRHAKEVELLDKEISRVGELIGKGHVYDPKSKYSAPGMSPLALRAQEKSIDWKARKGNSLKNKLRGLYEAKKSLLASQKTQRKMSWKGTHRAATKWTRTPAGNVTGARWKPGRSFIELMDRMGIYGFAEAKEGRWGGVGNYAYTGRGTSNLSVQDAEAIVMKTRSGLLRLAELRGEIPRIGTRGYEKAASDLLAGLPGAKYGKDYKATTPMTAKRFLVGHKELLEQYFGEVFEFAAQRNYAPIYESNLVFELSENLKSSYGKNAKDSLPRLFQNIQESLGRIPGFSTTLYHENMQGGKVDLTKARIYMPRVESIDQVWHALSPQVKGLIRSGQIKVHDARSNPKMALRLLYGDKNTGNQRAYHRSGEDALLDIKSAYHMRMLSSRLDIQNRYWDPDQNKMPTLVPRNIGSFLEGTTLGESKYELYEASAYKRGVFARLGKNAPRGTVRLRRKGEITLQHVVSKLSGMTPEERLKSTHLIFRNRAEFGRWVGHLERADTVAQKKIAAGKLQGQNQILRKIGQKIHKTFKGKLYAAMQEGGAFTKHILDPDFSVGHLLSPDQVQSYMPNFQHSLSILDMFNTSKLDISQNANRTLLKTAMYGLSRASEALGMPAAALDDLTNFMIGVSEPGAWDSPERKIQEDNTVKEWVMKLFSNQEKRYDPDEDSWTPIFEDISSMESSIVDQVESRMRGFKGKDASVSLFSSKGMQDSKFLIDMLDDREALRKMARKLAKGRDPDDPVFDAELRRLYTILNMDDAGRKTLKQVMSWYHSTDKRELRLSAANAMINARSDAEASERMLAKYMHEQVQESGMTLEILGERFEDLRYLTNEPGGDLFEKQFPSQVSMLRPENYTDQYVGIPGALGTYVDPNTRAGIIPGASGVSGGAPSSKLPTVAASSQGVAAASSQSPASLDAFRAQLRSMGATFAGTTYEVPDAMAASGAAGVAAANQAVQAQAAASLDPNAQQGIFEGAPTLKMIRAQEREKKRIVREAVQAERQNLAQAPQGLWDHVKSAAKSFWGPEEGWTGKRASVLAVGLGALAGVVSSFFESPSVEMPQSAPLPPRPIMPAPQGPALNMQPPPAVIHHPMGRSSNENVILTPIEQNIAPEDLSLDNFFAAGPQMNIVDHRRPLMDSQLATERDEIMRNRLYNA